MPSVVTGATGVVVFAPAHPWSGLIPEACPAAYRPTEPETQFDWHTLQHRDMGVWAMQARVDQQTIEQRERVPTVLLKDVCQHPAPSSIPHHVSIKWRCSAVISHECEGER
ncbi:hypothetical protein BAUCODRAFT_126878 [Baudoinia panamericana UAMH 10762]|uniref:Uncharacterized protein n=1 Tax=Baudoinia panamericana (strain UAMH 10762) TaxID=717646 RepID=M2MKQ0_BAUPA|nr:uncharacterized protein BAUCODRAFT_126878 [Baudoinia panamericana UAMH 10762]EMC91908.1 hypothetical protein BAUCODRAFT_126878 [Baudoinia panamericana UAMH 10762]